MSGKSTLFAPPRPLVERKKRSCTECRRRKQKCDQKQPCRNCARRASPQPLCQYEGSPYVPGRPEARRDRIGRAAYRQRRTQRYPPADLYPLPSAAGSSSSVPTTTTTTAAAGPSVFTTYPVSGPLFVQTSVSLDHGGSDLWAYDPSPAGGGGPSLPRAQDPAWNYQPDLYSAAATTDPYSASLLAGEGSTVSIPYIDSFLPFTVESPSVSRVPMYARTVLNREATITSRGQAIRAVHGMLSVPELSASNEAIMAVAKLVMSDLCSGETQDLRMHINAIREMTTLRGGLASLGSDTSLAKTVIIVDLLAGIALEMAPSHTSREISDYSDVIGEPLGSGSARTPAAPSPQSSTSVQFPTSPSPEEPAAAMLKDVGFLVDTVLALPAEPSQWQQQKVQSVLGFVYNRLTGASSDPASLASTYPLANCVRLASLLYCQTIQARQPLSSVVDADEMSELVTAVWQVSTSDWSAALETLVWVLAATLPTARGMRQCYASKSMIVAASLQLARADWGAAVRVLGRVVKLQKWLRGGGDE